MGNARLPGGTGYPGVTFGMDIDPDELLRRLAYGSRKPLMTPWQRFDAHFANRLLAEMTNSHTVLVKQLTTSTGAYKAARALRAELPPEGIGVFVDNDKTTGRWNVIAFHHIPIERRLPPEPDAKGEVWIGLHEVARVLHIGKDYARLVVHRSGIPIQRRGGRNELRIRQQDLAVLAVRPRRHKRPARKAG